MRSVAWRDGEALYAEQLYADKALACDYAYGLVGAAWPAWHGFTSLRLGPGLEQGCITVSELVLWLADGRVVRHENLLGGARVDLPSETADLVWVTLKPERACAEERYVAHPLEAGSGRMLEFSREAWTLECVSGDLRGSIALLALARRAGRWEVAEGWLPPVLRVDAHPAWRQRLGELRESLGRGVESPERVRLSRLWNALGGLHPMFLYLECVAVCPDIPAYDHGQAVRWLDAFKGRLNGGNSAMTSRCQPLASLGNSLYMAPLAGLVDQGGALVLEIAALPGASLPMVEDIRVGALSKLPRMLRMALPGVGMEPVACDNPLVMRLRLKQGGAAWDECRVEEVLGLHSAAPDSGWKMTLYKEEI